MSQNGSFEEQIKKTRPGWAKALGEARDRLAEMKEEHNIHANDVRRSMGLKPIAYDKNHCQWCGEYIQITIFRGDGWCSDDHRKLIQGSQD